MKSKNLTRKRAGKSSSNVSRRDKPKPVTKVKVPKITKEQKLIVCGPNKNEPKLPEGLEINMSWEKGFANSPLGKDPNNTQKALMRMFKVPFSPSKITPRNDYYTYINYRWISDQEKRLKTKKQYFVQQDSFRMGQDEVYHELMEMTEAYIKNNNTPRSKSISNVYKSFLHLNEKSAEAHAKHIYEFVEEYTKSKTLLEFLAEINKNEVVAWGSPIVWGINPNNKKSNIYTVFIGAGQLALYDYDLYGEIDAYDPAAKYKTTVKREYFVYIDRLFTACIGKDHGLLAQDIWDVENQILDAFVCTEIPNDSPNNYNNINGKDAIKYGFDWPTFAKAMGYANVPDKIVVTSLNYLKCIMRTLQSSWTTPKWKTYWLYLYYRQLARFHNKWRPIHHDFHEKLISGQSIMFPPELYPVFGLSACFNTFLTNEFIAKNKRMEYILYVGNMADDLKEVFTRIIERNTWLAPSTKKVALLKLKTMKLIVGSPTILREDPLLDYTDNDAWGNLSKLSLWRTKQCTVLHNQTVQDIPVIDWQAFKLVGTQAYVVNASYTADQNAIYIPLGILRKPFIDLDERGIEYNLAHIGFTLGHELSHSLDTTGSQYDQNGNFNNWWTDADRKVFNTKVKDVCNQYEEFAGRDGIKMDATMSSGENLADISGLAICSEYLKDFQTKNEDIVPIRSLSFEAFFCYYAIQARQQISRSAIEAQLKSNPHPLDKYRTNCPLSRIALFKSIFNIQKGDNMYWHNSDTIW